MPDCFRPSAAGAVGAFGVFIVYLARRRRIGRGRLAAGARRRRRNDLHDIRVLIGGLIFSRMLVVLGMIDEITASHHRFRRPPIEFLSWSA